jgi:hypothetical protein
LEIDAWGPSILQLQINSILALELTPGFFPQTSTECGNGYSEGLYNLNYLFQPHDNENLLVEFKTMGATGKCWGMREVSLTLKLCDDRCNSCTGPANFECLSCVDQYFFLSGYCIFCNVGYFLVSQQCLPCHITCGECFRSSKESCTNCFPPEYFLGNRCIPPTSKIF